MKNLFKYILVSVFISVAFSCSDSEALIDQVLDSVDTESGVVLRTVQKPQDLVSLTNPTNNVIMLTVEVQEGNGSSLPDFKEVRAYVDLYKDQDLTLPLLDANENEIGERILATYSSSEFLIDANNLPRISLEIPTQSVKDTYPENAVYTVPTFIALRFEVEMNDGRVFTNVDLGASVTGDRKSVV